MIPMTGSLFAFPDRREITLCGTIILGEDFQPYEGYLCVRDGMIAEIGSGAVDHDIQGIISPALVNAHTHIGDSIIKDPPYLPLADLVGPGGLKHRAIAGAPANWQIQCMRRTLSMMRSTGTCAFADFREGGVEGVEMLRKSLEGAPIICRILGRPDGASQIHSACWGIGISSTRDGNWPDIRDAADKARDAGKVVAVHAGEAGRDDIRPALDLDPDYIVHLCRASKSDLSAVAAKGVSVVICPRSNLATGSGLPDVREMLRLGITVGVGTDNVMLNSPSMWREMELLTKALLHDDRQVFKMCTLNGAKILGIDDRVGSISVGKEARLTVLDPQSDNLWALKDPLAGLVRRAGPCDIAAVL